MAGIINIRVCFLLLILVVVSRGFDGLTEEPKCFSKFDYDYKLMHLVVNLERQLNEMTTTTERLKTEIKEVDTTCKEKLTDVRASLSAETLRTETLEKKVQELTTSPHDHKKEANRPPRWNPWTEWSGCFVNCTGPSGGRLQTRSRSSRELITDRTSTENESRPCNAVQYAGCVHTASTEDEFAIVYDYRDMIAQAACTAVGKRHMWAIRRLCGGQLSCQEVCGNVGTNCINALHVYDGQSVPARGEHGNKALKVYKYDSCSGVYCGPNYCCCESA